jgi:uncharacterized membrane protein HdeD (DUF308 family)
MGGAALILVVSATIASVYTIAIFMILAGGAEIAPAFLSAKTWGRFLILDLRGTCLYRRRGLARAQPLVAAAFFTLVLGAGMIATGIVRIYLGMGARPCSACGRAYSACGIVDRCGLTVS